MGVTQKLETERLLLEITFGFKDKYLRIPVVFFLRVWCYQKLLYIVGTAGVDDRIF